CRRRLASRRGMAPRAADRDDLPAFRSLGRAAWSSERRPRTYGRAAAPVDPAADGPGAEDEKRGTAGPCVGGGETAAEEEAPDEPLVAGDDWRAVSALAGADGADTRAWSRVLAAGACGAAGAVDGPVARKSPPGTPLAVVVGAVVATAAGAVAARGLLLDAGALLGLSRAASLVRATALAVRICSAAPAGAPRTPTATMFCDGSSC